MFSPQSNYVTAGQICEATDGQMCRDLAPGAIIAEVEWTDAILAAYQAHCIEEAERCEKELELSEGRKSQGAAGTSSEVNLGLWPEGPIGNPFLQSELDFFAKTAVQLVVSLMRRRIATLE